MIEPRRGWPARGRELSRPALAFALALPLLAAAALPAVSAEQGFDLQVQLAREAGAQAGRLVVRFTMQNRGPRAVEVLPWGTPLEGILGNIFQVTCGGGEASYHGPMVKRSQPTDGDYVRIEGSGGSRSRSVDVAAVYDLRGGSCRIRWQGRPLVRAAAGEGGGRAGSRRRTRGTPIPLATPEVVVGPATAGLGVISFSQCNSNQQAMLTAALPAAQGLATTAESDLQAVSTPKRPSFDRYTVWFGSYVDTRYDSMIGLYDQIQAAAGGNLTFDCSGTGTCGTAVKCQAGWFAFTCAGGVGKTIWPCDAFWSAPESGMDSKPGTVVHELSHWYGTDDKEYGCGACQQLARDNPGAAVQNADNCEYFAENFGITCP